MKALTIAMLVSVVILTGCQSSTDPVESFLAEVCQDSFVNNMEQKKELLSTARILREPVREGRIESWRRESAQERQQELLTTLKQIPTWSKKECAEHIKDDQRMEDINASVLLEMNGITGI